MPNGEFWTIGQNLVTKYIHKGSLTVDGASMRFAHTSKLNFSGESNFRTDHMRFTTDSVSVLDEKWEFDEPGMIDLTLNSLGDNAYTTNFKFQMADEALVGFIQKKGSTGPKDHYFLFGKRGGEIITGDFIGESAHGIFTIEYSYKQAFIRLYFRGTTDMLHFEILDTDNIFTAAKFSSDSIVKSIVPQGDFYASMVPNPFIFWENTGLATLSYYFETINILSNDVYCLDVHQRICRTITIGYTAYEVDTNGVETFGNKSLYLMKDGSFYDFSGKSSSDYHQGFLSNESSEIVLNYQRKFLITHGSVQNWETDYKIWEDTNSDWDEKSGTQFIIQKTSFGQLTASNSEDLGQQTPLLAQVKYDSIFGYLEKPQSKNSRDHWFIIGRVRPDAENTRRLEGVFLGIQDHGLIKGWYDYAKNKVILVLEFYKGS
jgi:hypothetical protein